MFNKDFSIAIPFEINERLKSHLIIGYDQEEVAFALWNPSEGLHRYTALISDIILPEEGERTLQGNVAINPAFFKRACKEAIQRNCGLMLLHSHPSEGWQGMSADDFSTEHKFSKTAFTLTDFPFVGMTIGQDGFWSGRIWNLIDEDFQESWAKNVRVVGKCFDIYYNPNNLQDVSFLENFKRTVNVWGKTNHRQLTRLKFGIVGLGSVGSIVAETLSRMGMQNIVLLDFDKVEMHNLDRLLGANEKDLGRYKVDVISESIERTHTSKILNVEKYRNNVADEIGYKAILDCDVIFSCVDKPRARYVLNHIAFSHLIPIIDGGILVKFDDNADYLSANWQTQIIAPERPCLQCLGLCDSADVYLEKDGLLDDPSYFQGGGISSLKNNENVFCFSTNLASQEVFQMLNYVLKMGNPLPIQRYDFNNGIIRHLEKSCNEDCPFPKGLADGDKHYVVYDPIKSI